MLKAPYLDRVKLDKVKFFSLDVMFHNSIHVSMLLCKGGELILLLIMRGFIQNLTPKIYSRNLTPGHKVFKDRVGG